tara:strand:+ start:1224 stop:2045 length:822 start_codon:yes stop_codon:yes gene_type:complete
MKIFDYNFLLLLGICIIVYFIYRDVEDLKYKINAIEKSLDEPEKNFDKPQIELPLPPPPAPVEVVEKINDKINIDLNESCTDSINNRKLLENNVEIYSNDAEILGTDNTLLESAKIHMDEKPVLKKIKVDSISLKLKEINTNKKKQTSDVSEEDGNIEKPKKINTELKEELQEYFDNQTNLIDKIPETNESETETEKSSEENQNIEDDTDEKIEKESEWDNPNFLSKFKKNKLAVIQAEAEKIGINIYKTSKNGKEKKKKKDELIQEIISIKK